ncbi:MAG: hypothetical protein SFU56_14110 [Capsulimonadales bacterium]|nr:hypothetical protein [Capsulimonadales bacterium]
MDTGTTRTMGTTETGSTGAGLETVTETIRGGVIGVPPEAAIGAIIRWENTLVSAGDADLQAIATDLATLRGALTADSLDGVTIGEVLLSLGNRVQNAAGNLDGALLGQLMELGDALNQEGARLRGDAPESDNGAGMSGRDLTGETRGPEVGGTSLTTGASFTGGSATMDRAGDFDADATDVTDTSGDSNDRSEDRSDFAATGRSGGGI